MIGKWLTPVVTAFDKQGNIDYKANGNIYDFLIKGGIDGIVVLGSTGEFFSMSMEQKKSLIKFAVNYINKRTKVIIGSSCMRADDTIELSNFAYDVGADAVMVISPYYFALSRESIELYYDKVASGCKLPIYLYNFPDRTGYDLTPDIILSLSRKHKNIIGCKDTVTEMGHTRAIIEIMRKENTEFEVYSGYDENFAHNILSGGAGCIGGISNFVPEICSEAVKVVNERDFDKIEKMQKIVNGIMKIYDIGNPFIPIVKRAMMLRKIEMEDHCTEPFIKANYEQEEKIKELLKEFNLEEKEEDKNPNRIVLNETSYHGSGSIREIVTEAKKMGNKKALLCSDADLIKFGVTKKVTDILDEANLEYEIFSNIKQNPTIENVLDGVSAYKNANAEYIIAVGGGSSIDTAKAIGIIINNPEFIDVRSLEGVAPTRNKSVPIIAVPTTAGTAAEVTINYVITDVEKNRKFVCVDTNDIPVVAIIDPDMTESMPKSLTAATGMDALTHAIEGYTTLGAWEMTDMFHLKAVELISKHLRGAVDNTKEGREGMALAQYIAGMGFSNVGLGIVHSMAHTLGAVYNTPHGVANAILLPTVMEYNGEATKDKYKYIAKAMGVENVDSMSIDEYRKAAIDAVKKLSSDIGIPSNLKDIVKEEDISFLAQSAYDDACRPGNPKETCVEDIARLFENLI